MSDLQIYGPLVDGSQLEDAVTAHLKAWIREYLALVERYAGLAARSLEQPRSWVSASEVEKWPEDQLPAILVLNTGLAEPPVREEDGSYSGKFALGVVAVVGARDQAASDRLAKQYAAAVRAAIMQHPTIGGFAQGTEWVDEDYDPIPPGPGGSSRRRQLAGGQVIFRVEVDNILTAPAGLAEPRQNPYEEPADWPTVKEDGASVTIEKEPLA